LYYPLKSFKRRTAHTSRFSAWLKQSRYDLEVSQISYEHKYFEWSSYQATQSAEKAIKSLIVHSGWRPPRTHKLSVLIGIANSVNPEFRQERFKFRDLEIYTFVSRYPFLVPGEKAAPHDFVTRKEAISCIEEAKGIMQIVEHGLEVPVEEKFEDVEAIEKLNIEERLRIVTIKIIQLLKPEKIILFGGYAKGKKRLSTLDLIVIADTQLAFLDRIKLIRENTKGGFPTVSPLIYTPHEFDLMIQGGEGFLENAIEEGRVLYTKDEKKHRP
jgi:HEPN domain-containing protein/predicted nucleotidyltransferase